MQPPGRRGAACDVRRGSAVQGPGLGRSRPTAAAAPGKGGARSPETRAGTASDVGEGRGGGRVGAGRLGCVCPPGPSPRGSRGFLRAHDLPHPCPRARDAERGPGAAPASAESGRRGLLPGPPIPPTPLSPGAGRGKFLQQPRGEPPPPPGSCPSSSYLSPGGRSVGPRPSPSLGGLPGRPERLRRLDFLSPPLAGFLPAHLPPSSSADIHPR